MLRRKPVIVAWRGNRSVVCAASYEARKFGVRSAMPSVRAERLCPNAVFLPPDFPRYRAVSRHNLIAEHRITAVNHAIASARTLVDIYITLRYIANNDTDVRAQRYAQFAAKDSEVWAKTAER